MTKRKVLVVGHADADGHVISEQVRRNLSNVPSFDVALLVDPDRTENHKVWTRLDALNEAKSADIICFVDLMFAPKTFRHEAENLVAFAQQRSGTDIFVLDHHPLPLGRLAQAPNIHSLYRDDVLDCAIGPRRRMMVAAALNEDQPTRATSFNDAQDTAIAEGLHRAAALGGPLPGKKLSALLRANRWAEIAALGREDKRKHDLPRGRRRTTDRGSEALNALDVLAEKLLRTDLDASRTGAHTMAYDYDARHPAPAAFPSIPTADSRDLETIVTLLEMAAISLTTTTRLTFTRDELLAEARRYGGDEIKLEDKDVDLVIGKAGFLEKVPRKGYRVK